MAISWGTRKALGRRYSADPAMELEGERLLREYELAPGREARALQANQFDRNLALQKEQNEQAGKAAMVGSIANLGMSAATLRAMTMKAGQPFFGGFFGGGGSAVAPAAVDAAGGAGGVAAGAAPTVAGGGAGAGIGASVLPYAGPAAAGFFAPKMLNALHNDSTENIGTNLTLGIVRDEKTSGTIGGAAVGAAAGFAVGGPVGAVVGGVLGAVSEIADSWICTAIDILSGLSVETKQALSDLRRHTIKNHRDEAAPYFKNGHRLVSVINDGKSPDAVYEQLEETLVLKCVELVNRGELEAAYQHYKEVTEDLCKQYDVDLSFKEGE